MMTTTHIHTQTQEMELTVLGEGIGVRTVATAARRGHWPHQSLPIAAMITFTDISLQL
jgi:hypothetical protein